MKMYPVLVQFLDTIHIFWLKTDQKKVLLLHRPNTGILRSTCFRMNWQPFNLVHFFYLQDKFKSTANTNDLKLHVRKTRSYWSRQLVTGGWRLAGAFARTLVSWVVTATLNIIWTETVPADATAAWKWLIPTLGTGNHVMKSLKTTSKLVTNVLKVST